jgi:amino-acid N-acetyltransferase
VQLIRIERARPSDVPAVLRLLAAAGLPLDGAAQALQTGVVAREGETVVGAAGVERYGSAGLLRSVAVAPERQGEGLGRQLVAAAERVAREEGVTELFLLTETAIGWFPRLGYAVVPREDAAAVVGASVEFRTACPDTSIAMHRVLN